MEVARPHAATKGVTDAVFSHGLVRVPEVPRNVLDNPTPERWFNTAAFQFSTPFTFGNAGRNVLDGPGY
jgi:hypothetical protein